MSQASTVSPSAHMLGNGPEDEGEGDQSLHAVPSAGDDEDNAVASTDVAAPMLQDGGRHSTVGHVARPKDSLQQAIAAQKLMTRTRVCKMKAIMMTTSDSANDSELSRFINLPRLQCKGGIDVGSAADGDYHTAGFGGSAVFFMLAKEQSTARTQRGGLCSYLSRSPTCVHAFHGLAISQQRGTIFAACAADS